MCLLLGTAYCTGRRVGRSSARVRGRIKLVSLCTLTFAWVSWMGVVDACCFRALVASVLYY